MEYVIRLLEKQMFNLTKQEIHNIGGETGVKQARENKKQIAEAIKILNG